MLVVMLDGVASTLQQVCWLLLVSATLIGLFAAIIIRGNRWVDRRFDEIGPHKYSRDVENGRLLIPKFRIYLNIGVIVVIIVVDSCFL